MKYIKRNNIIIIIAALKNKMGKVRKFTSKTFNYEQDFNKINFRERPDLYQIGRGEQGVLMVEPYKSEILPHWRFKNAEVATKSSDKIYSMFEEYLEKNDFPGADMARKFLQMGYTRARRYANHKGGRKFKKNPQKEENEKQARKEYEIERLDRKDQDPDKVAAARIFKEKWDDARNNEEYNRQKEEFKQKYTTKSKA
jgi:hypothetical protein